MFLLVPTAPLFRLCILNRRLPLSLFYLRNLVLFIEATNILPHNDVDDKIRNKSNNCTPERGSRRTTLLIPGRYSPPTLRVSTQMIPPFD
jgi:hypothetical protein